MYGDVAVVWEGCVRYEMLVCWTVATVMSFVKCRTHTNLAIVQGYNIKCSHKRAVLLVKHLRERSIGLVLAAPGLA